MMLLGYDETKLEFVLTNEDFFPEMEKEMGQVRDYGEGIRLIHGYPTPCGDAFMEDGEGVSTRRAFGKNTKGWASTGFGYTLYYLPFRLIPLTEFSFKCAQERGIRSCAKIQVNNSWECSSTPHLPVFELVLQHLENLKNIGVKDYMLTWTLGGISLACLGHGGLVCGKSHEILFG